MMTRVELAEHIAKDAEIPRKAATKILDVFVGVIHDALQGKNKKIRVRSVVNSGHQMSRLPSVVDRIDSQRPLGRDSPAFSGVSADCRKALCIL